MPVGQFKRFSMGYVKTQPALSIMNNEIKELTPEEFIKQHKMSVVICLKLKLGDDSLSMVKHALFEMAEDIISDKDALISFVLGKYHATLINKKRWMCRFVY